MGLNYRQQGETINYTPGSDVTAGTPIRLANGQAGVALSDIAANTLGALRVKGIFEGPANSSDTWNAGDPLVWDESADKIVKRALTLDGSADFYLGVSEEAKTNGQTTAKVRLNVPSPANGVVAQSVVYEFDTETGVDAATHVLIPASHNPNGLLLLAAYGIVTEVFAGASQDQGIVTVEDTDGTDLCTLTPSDTSADAVNDVIVGTADVFSATTADAAKIVAAGKGVQGVVSQATSGAGAAGKMKVYCLFMPLV
ncbi:MAG: DUF2190 family protein [Planctomycetes bacterium]|nr:DUF2190 family protein [Planctomycetota bacterium]